jgi:pyruvate formate lyase activating enzyme
VHDLEGDTTFCPSCGSAVIERDWYELVAYRLDEHGRCACGTRIAGWFAAEPKKVMSRAFGRRRVRLAM